MAAQSRPTARAKRRADDPAGFVVRGRVSYPHKSPAVGLTVLAFDKDIQGEDRLGQATIDTTGGYHITYSAAQFRRSPTESRGADVFVRILGANDVLLFQSKTVVNAPADLCLDVNLPAAQFAVRGQVRLADGTLLAGALLRAYDKDLRSERPLGEATTTDEDGRYEIRYTASQFARAGKHSANLIVRVVSPGGGVLAESTIVFHARPEETIHLVVVEYSGRSEYELLIAELAPIVQDMPLHQLHEIAGGLQSAIDFLAGDTGQDRQHIAWLARAATLAHESVSRGGATPSRRTETREAPAEVFYGWFRQGLPTDSDTLWRTPTDTLLTALRAAIEQRVVPSSIGANLDEISKRIEQIRLELVLKAPVFGTPASLGDLLATLPAPLNLDQQRTIAATVTDLRPEDPQLVKRIAGLSGFEGHAAGVARTLRLGALTGGHLPLVQALQLRLKHSEESEGALRPLAALRPDDWLDLAYTHGTPDGFTETPAAYAGALAASVERQYPTASLAAHLTGGRRLACQPMLADVGAFLRDNPTFDIAKANLSVLTEQAELGGIAKPKLRILIKGLRALQRMNVLGASWEETATLLENDLHSPHQLLAAGQGRLLALLDGMIPPERVSALYNSAAECRRCFELGTSRGNH